ncbi:MAG: hypothetical protein ACI9Z4_000416 [Polaribacter sp.]|jgi:hypothetical protein
MNKIIRALFFLNSYVFTLKYLKKNQLQYIQSTYDVQNIDYLIHYKFLTSYFVLLYNY